MTTATTDNVKKAVIAVEIEGTTLRATFSNGKVMEIPNAKTLNPDIQIRAMMHGLKQKLVDAAAIARDTETGRPATVQDKFEAVLEVFNRVTDPNGVWNKIREAGEGGNGGLLFQALVRMYDGKKTKEYIREFLDGKSDKEQAALRTNPKVAQIINEIRAERAKAANVDTDSLLSELDES